MGHKVEIETLHLLPILDKMLIEFLKSLTAEEWECPTVAKLWRVKDVASHLLDGNLRGLSVSRDGYFGEKPTNINSHQDLIAFLNNLNMSWTNTTKRLSPNVLINLLETSGAEYTEHLKMLKPFEKAVFPVAWAGQEASQNWFHIAREYTEKFLHQQQMRDAVNKQGIMTKDLFYPFIDTLMYAFPHTFQSIDAEVGTTISLIVATEIGGQWNITKTADIWKLSKGENLSSVSKVIIDPNTAWKLFSKSWGHEQVIDKVEIIGDKSFGEQVLKIVAVMA